MLDHAHRCTWRSKAYEPEVAGEVERSRVDEHTHHSGSRVAVELQLDKRDTVRADAACERRTCTRTPTRTPTRTIVQLATPQRTTGERTHGPVVATQPHIAEGTGSDEKQDSSNRE